MIASSKAINGLFTLLRTQTTPYLPGRHFHSLLLRIHISTLAVALAVKWNSRGEKLHRGSAGPPVTKAITELVYAQEARLIIQLRKLSVSSHMWCRGGKKQMKACSGTRYGRVPDTARLDTSSHLQKPWICYDFVTLAFFPLKVALSLPSSHIKIFPIARRRKIPAFINLSWFIAIMFVKGSVKMSILNQGEIDSSDPFSVQINFMLHVTNQKKCA